LRRRRAGRPKVRESSVRIIATRLYSRAKVTGTGTPLELPRFVPSKVRCVVLGAMGTRETSDGGYERMSSAECTVARRQATSIVLKDVLIAAVITAAIWLV